jgi:peptidoglycan/xylan/chitin deacetylase (PgdA/CDA1 family)
MKRNYHIFYVLCLVALYMPVASCSRQTEPEPVKDRFGAVTRFIDPERSVYLFFSAHDHFQGIFTVLGSLERHDVQASFFLTGDCLRDPENEPVIMSIIEKGHYLGPHSDKHLLYVPWDVGPERDSLLLTKEEFEKDLLDNILALEPFPVDTREVKWFLPPYEWYNRDIVEWTNELGMEVVNFTTGIGTNADYTTPDMPNYRTSEEIIARLWEYEAGHGLEGKILLIHPGIHPDRPDPLYDHLYDIISDLKSKGYVLKRLNH